MSETVLTKPKIGIVLSGGGARGIAHLGILKALEEFGVQPTIISGTSAGAIAGAFYAKGFSIKEILAIVKSGKFFNFSSILIKKQGVFSMKGFENIYKQYFPKNVFSDLKIPLYVTATDIMKGEVVHFSTGNLSMSLMASSCIPVVFQPIAYKGTYFVDGGVLDNFPIDPILNKCDKVIGIYVNSIKKEVEAIHMNDILDRSFHLALNNNLGPKIKKCALFIEPPDMSQYGIFDLKKIEEIFEYGYQYGRTLEKEVKALLGE
ncbi:patatin [Putridiphycobacter roseus]|uniref:Patatin n=1 Tax=Putridiphycobacter roseus TaxID=2219161 RepID=A0A2W1NSK3_9FLAO|nr:patatin-like phospholipase family protein [Putridiphycobacter roseus]PZE17658.1 patatin [Putridiphycobacter roseus]